ncbi:type III polyketide synthase [uncultured Nisaea sp.]|uniref:type III polyketide synthase n=1 Tax=uncultured Nisaea sp. TaxID=538215 RepID=UPI0030EEC2CD|tara:strand:- start:1668 stop:2714 length:1047 start_codon:yes stop_codon:yes gene_type:complete
MINPRLLSVATAVPRHRLSQSDALAHARKIFEERVPAFARLAPVYGNAGVESRYLSVPLDWFARPRSWAEANRIYLQVAEELLADAARTALEGAGIAASEVDTLIVVSSTGIATPSLDARMLRRLDFREDVKRVPLFGLGCAGGVLGLGRAAQFAASGEGETVLLLVVELCSLTFRWSDTGKSNQVATAIFGDGAAAAVLRGGDGEGTILTAWGEHTWPDSLDVMGWSVEEDGFGVIFSPRIPEIVRTGMRSEVDRFLARHKLTLSDIDLLACHPGGAKVAAALEEAFDLPEGGLAHARSVLRDYGNMSAATVFFVLERMRADGTEGQRVLVQALGPGFTAGFAVLEG